MTKVIIIQGGSLDSYYEKTLNYLHEKYHTYPSNLLDLHIDPDVMARDGMYERLAKDTANAAVSEHGSWQAVADAQGHGCIGKIVL
jgi:hypothetical protein